MSHRHVGIAAGIVIASCGVAASAALGAPRFEDIYGTNAPVVSADGLTVAGSGWVWTRAEGLRDLYGPTYSFSLNARAISDDGSIIAGSSALPNMGGVTCRWTEASGAVVLDDLSEGGMRIGCYDMSWDGSVIVGGASPLDYSVPPVAIRWTASAGVELLDPEAPPESYSRATAVSGDGSTIGGVVFDPASDPFVWTEATGMRTLESIVGTSFYQGEVNALSYDGAVVVGSAAHASGTEAFRWSEDGGLQWLGVIPGSFIHASEPNAVSADGSVVVGNSRFDYSGPPQFIYTQAFVWTEAGGMRSVKQVLEADFGLDLTGWLLTDATGVSGNGRVIVGTGYNPQGVQRSWIARLGPSECDADITGDDAVNSADFNILASHYGEEVVPGTSGDLTGDGVVSAADFNALMGDYGCGTD